MADKKPTITMLSSKRKSVSEVGSPSPSPKSMKSESDNSESDSDTNQPKVEIAAAAKPDIQIFPCFMLNDVTLVVEGINIHVNEDLLSSASPVFESWLRKEWQQGECTDNTKKELKFPGKTYAEMVIFLKCLLPISTDKVTTGTLATVLPLADEYQTGNLIKECAEVIRKHVESVSETDLYIPPPEVVKYLRWIEQYNLNSIENCVVKLASFLDTEEVQGVPDYQNVSKRLQLEVSNARAKLLESLMVLSVEEVDKKMYQFKIPRSSQYMATWKKKLAENVQAFLPTTPSQNNAVPVFISTTTHGVLFSQPRTPSLFTTSAASDTKPLITPSVAATFACISICDRFKFSASYLQSITRIRSLVKSKSEFKKLWEAHYASDSNKVRDHIERHVLQMCNCT